jgi:hypothetical protein
VASPNAVHSMVQDVPGLDKSPQPPFRKGGRGGISNFYRSDIFDKGRPYPFLRFASKADISSMMARMVLALS